MLFLKKYYFVVIWKFVENLSNLNMQAKKTTLDGINQLTKNLGFLIRELDIIKMYHEAMLLGVLGSLESENVGYNHFYY